MDDNLSHIIFDSKKCFYSKILHVTFGDLHVDNLLNINFQYQFIAL